MKSYDTFILLIEFGFSQKREGREGELDIHECVHTKKTLKFHTNAQAQCLSITVFNHA